MSLSTLNISGKGQIQLFLQITGLPYIFSTGSINPNGSDAWYSSGNYSGILPYMKYEGVCFSEYSSFIDGTLDVDSISLSLSDTAGGMTSQISSWRSRNFTRLTSTLTDSATTVSVVSTSGFTAEKSVIWIGQEAIFYTALTGTTFTGCTRGYYGTIATEHKVDFDARPLPLMPSVLSGPQTLANRRANIYLATLEADGSLSPSTCIYRGYLSTGLDAGSGEWRINVDHISKIFTRQVGLNLPKTKIQNCYYYSGGTTYGVSYVRCQEKNESWSSYKDQSITLNEGFYNNSDHLMNVLNALLWSAHDSIVANRYVCVLKESDYQYKLHCTSGSSYEVEMDVRKGDPIWALGFDEGRITFPPSASYTEYIAPNKARWFVCEIPTASHTIDRPTIMVEDASNFIDETYVYIKDSAWQQIEAITGNTITLKLNSFDALERKPYIFVEEEKDAIVSQIFVWKFDDIEDFIKRSFGLLSGQNEPSSWCINGLSSNDFDFTSLDTALIGAPDNLRFYYGGIQPKLEDSNDSGASLDSLLCDRLGLLGIAPCITSDGKIGFSKLKNPCALLADSISVDSSIWEATTASQVTTSIESEPLLNQIKIAHSHSYSTDKYVEDCTINYADGINEFGKTRSKIYKCFGLQVTEKFSLCPTTVTQLAWDVARRAIGLHFHLYGKVAPVIQIPCTWTAKQLMIGDIVSITHPCIVDVANGTVGVSERYGIVIGRTWNITDDTVDSLSVLLPPQERVTAISPCALATSYNSATKTLTFADTDLYCQSGNDDLDLFSEGDVIGFLDYDTETPTTWDETSIISVSSGEIVLKTDIFGESFPTNGVMVHFPTFDQASSIQASYLYQADNSYTIGTSAIEAFVWGA